MPPQVCGGASKGFTPVRSTRILMRRSDRDLVGQAELERGTLVLRLRHSKNYEAREEHYVPTKRTSRSTARGG
jgi:hypothetical protein